MEQTNPLPNPPLPPEIPTNPPVNPSFPNKYVLIIVVFLILFGAGGLILGKSLYSPKPAASPTSSVLPTPTPDLYTEQSRSETANWQLYKNAGLKFEFKYPIDWTVKPLTVDSPIAHGIVSLYPNDWKDDGRPGRIGLRYWDNPNNLSLQEYKQKYSYARVYDPNSTVITVNNKSAYLSQKADCEPFYCDRLIILLDNNILEIDSYFTIEQNIPLERKAFNQILSTFKFLN